MVLSRGEEVPGISLEFRLAELLFNIPTLRFPVAVKQGHRECRVARLRGQLGGWSTVYLIHSTPGWGSMCHGIQPQSEDEVVREAREKRVMGTHCQGVRFLRLSGHYKGQDEYHEEAT